MADYGVYGTGQGAGAVAHRKDVDDKPKSSKYWLMELSAAENRQKRWVKRANKVIQRYRDEREAREEGVKRANIFWSNTEVLKSALFSATGKPDVRRRFPKRGQEEKTARTVSVVLENALTYCADAYDDEAQFECAVEDHLITGRGQAWLVYDAVVEDAETGEEEAQDSPADASSDGAEGSGPDTTGMGAILPGLPGGPPLAMGGIGQPQTPNAPAQAIRDQHARIEHVFWQDFRHSAGRKWGDITWVARAHYFTGDEIEENFPEHKDKVPLNHTLAEGVNKSDDDKDLWARACVWEIWDKVKKERLYVADGYDLVLKRDDDPYQLEHFFPCPEPLFGIKTTSTMEPIPEFCIYQDQADELDEVTTRIYRLTNALKRRGVYDATADGGDNPLSNLAYADDNHFIPYANFAALMEKGGLKGVFQTEDLSPIVTALQGLLNQRSVLVQTIYEITGISDIMRGQSDPRETATAASAKTQFGSLRVQRRQKRVQKFVRDLYRMKAELMAEHFTRERLEEMTGVRMPTRIEIAQAKAGLQQAQMAQAQMAAQQMGGVQQAIPNQAPPMPGGMGGPPPMGPPPAAPPAPHPMPAMAPPSMAGMGQLPPGMGPPGQPTPQPMGPAMGPQPPGIGPPGMPPPGAQPGMPGMPGIAGGGISGGPMGGAPMPPGMPPGFAVPPPLPPPPIPAPPPEQVAEWQEIVKCVAWEDLADILRSDERRGYKIDIETDALAWGDEQQDKQSRIEFLTTMQGFMGQMLQGIQQMPLLAPLAKEGMMFVLKGFKVGRSMEEAFEDALEQLATKAQQAAQNPQAAPPNPELVKIEADSKQRQAELAANSQAEAAKLAHAKDLAQFEAQAAQAKAAQEAELRKQEMERDAAIEMAKLDTERELGYAKLNQAAQAEQARMEFEADKHATSMELEWEKADRDMAGPMAGAPPSPDGAAQLPPGGPPTAPSMYAGPLEAPDATGPRKPLRLRNMAQTIDDLGKAHQDTQANQAQILELLQKLSAAHAAPKKLLRDEAGRPIGAETGFGRFAIARHPDGRVSHLQPMPGPETLQ